MTRHRTLAILPVLGLIAVGCSGNNDVTNTPPPPPPSSLTLEYQPCLAPGDLTPVLVAVREGIGPWKTLTASGGSYSADVDSARVSFLRVAASGGNDDVLLINALATEVKQFLAAACIASNYAAVGVVNNLGPNDEALVSAGTSSSAVAGPGNKSISVAALATSNDVLAILYPTPYNVSKMILRRGVGVSLDPIDFTGTEGFAPVTPPLTVTGAGSVASTFSEWYLTGGGDRDEVVIGSPSTALPSSYWGVPAAAQVAGDLHEIYLTTTGTLGSTTTFRAVDSYTHDAVARNIAFDPLPTAPTITVGESAPYLRVRAQFQLPAGHKYVQLVYSPVSGSVDRGVTFIVSAGYLGNSIDMTFPDLSALPGWNNAWLPVGNESVNWGFKEYSWTGSFAVFAPPADGLQTQLNSWRAVLP